MSTPLLPDALIFNEKQRRQLGQVYSLILSWRNEAKQKPPVKPTAGEKPKEGRISPVISEKTE
jgi:hypothetical protein